MLSAELANSLLGSDIRYIKTEIEGAVFFPLANGHVFGIHLEYRSMTPFEDSKIPFWERFYLGGERSIRGYDVYSIGPRIQDGRNVGGEKSMVINLEYMIPLLEDFYSIFFFDIGNAYRYSEKMDLGELYWSSGLELRWRIPRTPIPVRFILAYNNRLIDRGDSRLAFRIALGTSF
jgi:outer membrane protein insertion porin family